MKLALSNEEGIAILTGTEAVTARDLDILRAGITKYLKSGRNRIILELIDAEQIPPEMIREVSKFDILARELSGCIVLAGKNDLLKSQVARFATPPIIQCFTSRAEALQSFRAKADPPPDLEALKKTKAEVRQRELTDSTAIRKELAESQNENSLLREQLLAALSTQKTRGAAQEQEVAALNLQIKELLAQVRVLDSKSK